MTKEIWKPIKNYEGLYDVSNMGRVRSLCKGHAINKKRDIPLIKTIYYNKKSYNRSCVHLWKNNQEKLFAVHRLVLTAFVGECPNGMEACHNDGNSKNNQLNNLRWDTHKNNYQDMVRHGTRFNHKGIRLYSKITKDDVIEIRKIGRTQTLGQIASKYPIGMSQISNILLEYCWKKYLKEWKKKKIESITDIKEHYGK